MRTSARRFVPLLALLPLVAACDASITKRVVLCRAEEVPMLVSLVGTDGEPSDAYAREAFWQAQGAAGGLALSEYKTKQGLPLTTNGLGQLYDVDAVTLGLDWIPVDWDHGVSPPQVRLAKLSPGTPGAEPGWAALFYSSDGDLWSYGWGNVTFVQQGLHKLPSMGQLAVPGRAVDALEYNAWFHADGDFGDCFEPPGAPSEVIDVLFSTSEASASGEGAILWAVTAIQDGGGAWIWSDRREVAIEGAPLELGTDPTKADIDALALDREHGVLLYSLDEDGSDVHPFYVAYLEEVIPDADGKIKSLVVRAVAPLRDESGNPFGSVIGPRPKAGCGIDPRPLRLVREKK